MEHRIVWIHGIGDHQAGYSDAWRRSFNAYLNLPAESFVEVLWESVFDANWTAARGRRPEAAALRLSRQEAAAAVELDEYLRAILVARASAYADAATPEPVRPRSRAAAGPVVEWARLRRASRESVLPGWLDFAGDYLGDFAKYLVSRRIRTAIKEEAKEALRPLAGEDVRVSIVAHSWGTVVAYDTLIDLEVELPSLEVADLFTLGSPLWLVRRFLDDRTGRKPGTLGFWMKIHARGDLVGSWLKPAFALDRDYQVPAFGPGDAHGSYFAEDNEAVQRDLVARRILA